MANCQPLALAKLEAVPRASHAPRIVLQHSAAEADLREKREVLAALRVRLVEREVEVAQVREQLRALGIGTSAGGRLVCRVDNFHARIDEREVALHDSDAAWTNMTEGAQFEAVDGSEDA